MNILNRFSNQEDLWSTILSEDSEKVISIFNTINPAEIIFIINHLKKMTTEDDWHPFQKRSAAFALDIIDKINL